MKIRILLSFVCLCFAGYIVAQKPKLPDDVKESIERRIEYGKNPSIVVGLINGDEVAYYAFGKTKEGGSKATENSIYEIGSISKTFTAIMLADQVLKGNMKVDDPVQLYLPATVTMPRFDGDNITLGQLSDHTSSLPRLPSNMAPVDALNPYADYTVDQLYDFLSTHELRRTIGSQYEYSNLAVGLLGHVLSLKTGMSYEELMRVTITNPLHMTATVIKPDANMKKNLAVGHANGVEVPNWDLGAIPGAGAIRSSVHDMVLYIMANMHDSKSSLSKAMQLTHQPRHDKANGSSVGLGWHITPGQDGDITWHNGGTGGYRAFAGYNPKTNQGIVVLTNSDQSVDDIGFHVLDPATPLNPVSPSIATWIRETIDRDGTDGLQEKFDAVKKGSKYLADENDINTLGYYYMGLLKFNEARAVFAINMREYPESFNVYDSYAESLMESGQVDSAKYYYAKSIEMNPANQNGIDQLAKLGVEYKTPDVAVDETILETYVGTYELAPGFTIVFTREGKQLFGQATGQERFELKAKSDTEFYLTVTPASVVFNKDEHGHVTMTLTQGGQTFVCKRI